MLDEEDLEGEDGEKDLKNKDLKYALPKGARVRRERGGGLLGMEKEFVVINSVSQNGAFGEKALKELSRRTASIRCKEDCIFVVLTKELYNQTMDKVAESRLNRKIMFLKQIRLLGGFSRSCL